MKFKKLKKGFTLVELVVVIAVIAVLAAVSVGAYFGVTDSANSSNATAAYKQIKDLWVMYSAADYNPDWSVDRNAKEFCLKHVEDLGPDYYVNYTIVAIDGVETETNNLIGKNDSNESAILFKIETKYPTWFIVSDLTIVEEGAPTKSNESFIESLVNSTRISQEDKDRIAKDDFAFDIETIKVDPVTGKEVRGFKFYDIVINNEDGTIKDQFSIRPGESIYSEERGYAIGDINTSIDGNGSTYIGYNFALFDGNTEVYSTDPVNLEEDLENATSINSFDPDLAYGYHVASKEYLYKDYTNGSTPVEYPYVLAKATEYSDTIGGTYEYGDGWLGNLNKNKKEVYYYAKKVELTYIQNDNYLSSDSFKDLSENNSNLTYFIFVNSKDAKITKEITINSNVCLVVGHYDATEMINLVSSSSKKVEYYDKTWRGWSKTGEGFKMFGDSFTNINHLIDEEKYNYVTDENQVVNPNARVKFLADETYIKSKLTIERNGKLKLMPNSYLIVDGIMHLPAASAVLQISNRGEIVNNGEIVLGDENITDKGAYLRTISKISGNGTIKAYGTSELLDIIRFDDFFGGTHATNSTTNKLFAYNNYVFDNITCYLELNYGVKYSVISGMYMKSRNFVTGIINIIASGNEESLFNLQENSQLIKKTNDNGISDFIISKGLLDDNFIEVSFEITEEDGLDDTIIGALSEITLNSKESNFPISNINFIVKNGTKLILDTDRSKGAYELLPSSSVSIENGGELTITNKAKLAVISPKDYVEIMGKVTTDADDVYSDEFKKEIAEFISSVDTITPRIVNEGTININNGSIYINKDGLETLEDGTVKNIYNLFVDANDIDMSKALVATYQYKYLIGDHATKKASVKSLPIYVYNSKPYTI